MNPPALLKDERKGKYSKPKRKKTFPWLGLALVFVGLGLIFYFIDSPDINKIETKKESSASFLGGADGNFKN